MCLNASTRLRSSRSRASAMGNALQFGGSGKFREAGTAPWNSVELYTGLWNSSDLCVFLVDISAGTETNAVGKVWLQLAGRVYTASRPNAKMEILADIEK